MPKEKDVGQYLPCEDIRVLVEVKPGSKEHVYKSDPKKLQLKARRALKKAGLL